MRELNVRHVAGPKPRQPPLAGMSVSDSVDGVLSLADSQAVTVALRHLPLAPAIACRPDAEARAL
eukprot:3959970-Prymnesium_polylepis.1